MPKYAETELSDLPDELVDAVFSFLPPLDRERMSFVCRRFRTIRTSRPLAYADVKLLVEGCRNTCTLKKLLVRYWDQADLERNLSEDPDDPLTPKVEGWAGKDGSTVEHGLLFYFQKIRFEKKQGWVKRTNGVMHELVRRIDASANDDDGIAFQTTSSLIMDAMRSSLGDRIQTQHEQAASLNDAFAEEGLGGRAFASVTLVVPGGVVGIEVRLTSDRICRDRIEKVVSRQNLSVEYVEKPDEYVKESFERRQRPVREEALKFLYGVFPYLETRQTSFLPLTRIVSRNSTWKSKARDKLSSFMGTR